MSPVQWWKTTDIWEKWVFSRKDCLELLMFFLWQLWTVSPFWDGWGLSHRWEDPRNILSSPFHWLHMRITGKLWGFLRFSRGFTVFSFRYESGDWSQKTDWHRIVVFKPQLRESVMSYLRRGQRAMVQGKISYGEITDQEGKQRVSTSIIADDVIFINPSGK